MENIDRYFKDVRKTQPLQSEEEIALAIRIQNGDKDAENKLIECNLRFVITEARKNLGRGLDLEDLIQEGNLGLIEAAKRFSPDAGTKFVTYAAFWIKQAIINALSLNRTVRLPMNVVGDVIRINRATDSFRSTEGRLPSTWELSDLLGIPEEDVKDLMEAATGSVSLDRSVKEDEEDGGRLIDLIEDVDALSPASKLERDGLLQDILECISAVLNKTESQIITGSLGLGKPVQRDEDLCKDLHIKQQQLDNIRNRGYCKLRKDTRVRKLLIRYTGK